jgi:CBS domain-containing protein
MRAKDIMRGGVVCARADMTLEQLAAFLTGRQITGAPVLDERGALVGVVSQTDIVRDDGTRAAGAPSYYWNLGQETVTPVSPDTLRGKRRVKDIMTKTVISADEATPVRRLARTMLRKKIHRILITRAGALVGIVTSTDMLRGLLDLIDQYEPVSKR